MKLVWLVTALLVLSPFSSPAQTRRDVPGRAEVWKMTQEQASSFARLALKGLQREYPNKPADVLNSDKDDVFFPIHPATVGRGISAFEGKARPTHQLRHAVDDDDGAVYALESFQERDEARGVLAVGDVYDEDDFRLREVALGLRPLVRVERSAEVVSRDAEAQRVAAVDLLFRVPERREQA